MASKPVTPPAQPVARFGDGDVSAAVFREEKETKDGKTFIAYNVSLRRSYKVDGEFKHTNTLRAKDLALAIDALDECKKYIFETDKSGGDAEEA
jgi:hypothetical protein